MSSVMKQRIVPQNNRGIICTIPLSRPCLSFSDRDDAESKCTVVFECDFVEIHFVVTFFTVFVLHCAVDNTCERILATAAGSIGHNTAHGGRGGGGGG